MDPTQLAAVSSSSSSNSSDRLDSFQASASEGSSDDDNFREDSVPFLFVMLLLLPPLCPPPTLLLLLLGDAYVHVMREGVGRTILEGVASSLWEEERKVEENKVEADVEVDVDDAEADEGVAELPALFSLSCCAARAPTISSASASPASHSTTPAAVASLEKRRGRRNGRVCKDGCGGTIWTDASSSSAASAFLHANHFSFIPSSSVEENLDLLDRVFFGFRGAPGHALSS